MIGGIRAGGFAAALMMLVSLVAAPAAAAPATAPASVPKISFQLPVTAAQSSAAAAPVAAVQPDAAVAPLQPNVAAAPAAPQQAVAAAAPQRRPLRDLIISFVDYGMQDAEHECLVKAIYFEARSESAEGQLAVAEVILNRAASGLYPPTICGVVTQAAQFSFIRAGKFPVPDTNSAAWRQALAIADVARKGLADAVPPNVLWYHATYVAPSWGRRLTRVAQIGTHIFYS
ncbi:MAG TPA: cell wall hydrolase [Methylobacterium sp.]|jgi:spore germination cell wall hydrolase CwlJ-like protein|nr:cell wall hydrolase [Methylobacterium sp.]